MCHPRQDGCHETGLGDVGHPVRSLVVFSDDAWMVPGTIQASGTDVTVREGIT